MFNKARDQRSDLYLDDLYLHILVRGRPIETVADGLNYVVNEAAVWVVDVSRVPREVTICNKFLTRTHKNKHYYGNTSNWEHKSEKQLSGNWEHKVKVKSNSDTT